MGVEYQQRWSARDSVHGFGHGLCDAWAAEYSAGTGLDPDDLVVIDPGNGFSYLFDLAGTLRGVSCSRAPRVVGVWGLSQPGAPGRDHNRMRGYPRPGRSGDDRGHLISCAAGGGYDINLVPMDAALNRGWSAEGSRFRALVFLTSDDKIAAVEVKGTLTAGRVPRLSRREITQMSAEWVDKAGNPGMADLGLRSADVYGAVAVINFADMTWRIALTADFSMLFPVTHLGQLTHLGWLIPQAHLPVSGTSRGG